MAKSNNQKAKILFLEHMLCKTGENCSVSMQEILTELSKHGIRAERKSIYDDMEVLRSFGMDIRFRRGRPGGYYLAGQMSPQPEEKTEEASAAGKASEKLSTLDVMTEELSTPDVMTEELSAPDGTTDKLSVQERKTDGSRTEWQKKNPEEISVKKQMKLVCQKEREEEIRKYFGETAQYKEKEADTFLVTTELLEGPQFYGWLVSMGTDVHILKPKKAIQAYRDYLKALAREYKSSNRKDFVE